MSRDLDLNPYWMPYTANRAFKSDPRLVKSASQFHYTTVDDRKVLDAFSGLWTTGLGHSHPAIVEAVQQQVAKLDYVAAFQVSHEGAFELARKLVDLAPEGFSHVFFTNSGSEGADTALKIALGYHRARGDRSRLKLIGRQRGYHGTNFGGMSVGGIPGNRAMFGNSLLPNTDHLPHTCLRENAFTKGLPSQGVELADALEERVQFHHPENIAAVMVEPVSGSGGVVVPPLGYLERLREICTRHGILLIFDEVITAFGRVGEYFGSQRFNVTPDIISTAKGLTNGVIPMGAVLIKQEIYDAFMQGPEHMVEFFHGYTYSGHPIAAAAALAALQSYEDDDAMQSARQLEGHFEAALHRLADAPHVTDIRNFGLMGAIDLAPKAGSVGARGFEVHRKCFERGVMVRHSGDNLQFAPFLTSTPDHVEEIFTTVAEVLGEL